MSVVSLMFYLFAILLRSSSLLMPFFDINYHGLHVNQFGLLRCPCFQFWAVRSWVDSCKTGIATIYKDIPDRADYAF
jgi:hypothetical protein